MRGNDLPSHHGRRRPRRRVLFAVGVGLLLLFVLRAFGVPAHLAWEHADQLVGQVAHEHAHEHAHGGSIEPIAAHRQEPDSDREHPIEDHLPDLLVNRPSNPAPCCDFAIVELQEVRVEAPRSVVARWQRHSPVRPRSRSPGPPLSRGPPAD